MKLMIASDIHGSAYYCRKMLEAYDREKADKLLLLGDILYQSYVSEEIVTRKWIRWFWNFRFWRTIVF